MTINFQLLKFSYTETNIARSRPPLDLSRGSTFYHSFSFNAISIKSDEVTKKDYVVVS
nr:MAG TPA: hypothetical protein [Caudoviricetes sp.]